MVFVLDQVVIQPVVQFNVNSYIGQDLKETYTTTEWTMEMNIKKDILGTQIGQYNNQAIYSTGPDEVYVRFGDAPIEGNRLQICTLVTPPLQASSSTTSSMRVRATGSRTGLATATMLQPRTTQLLYGFRMYVLMVNNKL